MTRIFIVKYSDLEDIGNLRAFTTKDEAERYVQLLEDETDRDYDPYLGYYVSELGLYNKIEDIDGQI